MKCYLLCVPLLFQYCGGFGIPSDTNPFVYKDNCPVIKKEQKKVSHDIQSRGGCMSLFTLLHVYFCLDLSSDGKA